MRGLREIFLQRGFCPKVLSITPLDPREVRYDYPVKEIIVKNHRMAYIDEGTGLPVVFIHGVASSLASFEGLYPIMIQKGYRVIGMDLLGYGKSDKPEIQYTVPFHADTVLELIKKLGLRDVVLVGHSMGAAVALYAVLEEQGAFRSIILLTPGGLSEFSAIQIGLFDVFYKLVWGRRFSNLKTAERFYRETVYHWTDEMATFLDTRKRQMLHPEWKKVQRSIKRSYRSTLQISHEILPRIQTIQKKVLVLLAANDNLVDNHQVETNIRKSTKGWEIQIFQRCGHNMHYDQKDRLLETMMEFVRRS